MIKQFLLLLALTPLVIFAQSTSSYPQCNVCGDGYYVNRPALTYNDTKSPAKTCGELNSEGKSGQISEDACKWYPAMLVNHCCKALNPVCHICGSGNHVNKPNAIFDSTNHPGKTCGKLNIDGQNGFISAAQCAAYPAALANICCGTQHNTPGTAPTPQPTPTQVANSAPQKLKAPSHTPGPTPTQEGSAAIKQKKDAEKLAAAAAVAAAEQEQAKMSQGGKAGLGIALTLLAVGGIFAFLFVTKRRATPRTVDTAGATLEPDGSCIKESATQASMEEVELDDNGFKIERLVV